VIRMIIVDDESLIRKGIITSIDWQLHEVDIVGEAANGREALQIAERAEPDIVLTDIRMPVMDGIRLSGLLRERFPHVRIVFLTGYDDFEYAQSAIRLKVDEYLLKPAGAEELLALVGRLKLEIDEEREAAASERTRRAYLLESLPYMRQNLLLSLVHAQRPDIRQWAGKAQALNLHLNGPSYQCAVLELDNYYPMTVGKQERDIEWIRYAVVNVAEEVMEGKVRGNVCGIEANRMLFLFNLPQGTIPETVTEDVCDEVRRCIARYLQWSVTVGIGMPVPVLERIGDSFHSAVRALRRKVYAGTGRVYRYEYGTEGGEDQPVLLPAEQENMLLRHLRLMDREKVHAAIGLLFEEWSRHKPAYVAVHRTCLRLVFMSMGALEDAGIRLSERMPMFDPAKEIDKLETLAQMETWLQRLLEQFMAWMEKAANRKFKSIVASVIRYMEEHLDQELTLDAMASAVYVSPSYLSRLFKEETGRNIVDYIHGLRIERAKALLRDPKLKTYEISERVGYRDYKYFSFIFKRYTGCSPRDYRNRAVPERMGKEYGL